MAHVGFGALASQLADRPGVTNPRALASVIGREKYGGKQMTRAAKKHTPLEQSQALAKKIIARRKHRRKHH